MMADMIRLGLIGASVQGTWSARSHLPAVQASPDVELTAVCTTKAASAEAARQAYGARLAFHDYREMIASPEIDAVAVVVRVPSHNAPTKAALEAGKHVYCEWPLARTTAEAVELSALAKANRLVTAVGLQARVNPALMHMKEQVEAGFVGEVVAVHVASMREGVLSRPSHRTWQRDAELGANIDHRQWPHSGRSALCRRRLPSALSCGGSDPGEAMARHRHQHIAGRHLARQRAAQRPASEWCGRVGPCRRHLSRTAMAAVAERSQVATAHLQAPRATSYLLNKAGRSTHT
jgi:Oxidoreductase family, NAD-binding Rossmann fold